MRQAVLVALCVLLGTITTVAISWYASTDQRSLHASGSMVVRTRPDWSTPVRADWPEQPAPRSLLRNWAYGSLLTQFSETAMDDFPWTVPIYYVSRYSYGWPIPALSYWECGVFPREHFSATAVSTEIPLDDLRDGLDIPRRRPALRPVKLPVVPRPIGFPVNVAVHSTAWATLLFGGWALLRAFVRRRRFRAGRCTACAYELRGLAVCPECGTERRRMSL